MDKVLSGEVNFGRVLVPERVDKASDLSDRLREFSDVKRLMFLSVQAPSFCLPRALEAPQAWLAPFLLS